MRKPKTWKDRLNPEDIDSNLKEHHRALCNYYHSRKKSAEFEAYAYEGMFGKGHIVVESDTIYHAAVVVYYISVE